MNDYFSYTLYYQSSSHGGITVTKEQADELFQIMDTVASSGRTVVWSMTTRHEQVWERTDRFLIGPHTPVRVEVMRRF